MTDIQYLEIILVIGTTAFLICWYKSGLSLIQFWREILG